MLKTTSIPSLTENTLIRYFNFIVLYLAQGIPEGMLLFGIPAWMAANGKSPGEIGAFAAAFGLPWSFKIIAAPLMDRFTYLPMGRKRPWVLIGQLGLIGSFIAMAFVPDPLNNLNLFMASAFAVGCFGAFQDVATDGMAIDIVPVNQQARANGFMWGSKIIGTSVSLALGSWLMHLHGFSIAILMLSVIVCLTMLFPLIFRERPGEKILPFTKGEASVEAKQMQVENWSVIFKSLYTVARLRNSLFLCLILFILQGSFNFMGTLMPIFTVKALGWTDVAYSQFYATASLIGGIGGMLLGGILIEKFGKIRMMNIYFFMLILLTGAMVYFNDYWIHVWFISAFMVIYKFVYVFACIGIFAIAMECCWKKVSASQFTLYMTIGNLGRIAGAKMIGPLKEQFSWEYTFFSFIIMLVLCWGLMQLVNISQHVEKVSTLESKEINALINS